jgi:membrane protein YqaA with SNARE-associated domain
VVAFGGPGLLLISFLDSSFLSLPEVVDVLVVWLTLRNKSLLVYYAGIGALGSLLGSLILYWLGRKGGESFLRKRFHERHVDRGLALFERWGVLALFVPSLLPPPTPFKLFVLMAGAGGVSPLRFTLAIVVGRGLRYFGQAWLAVQYGERALDMVKEHSGEVGIGVAIAIVLTAALVIFVRSRKGERAAA